MASKSKTLYVGFTNGHKERVLQHKESLHPHSFTSKYKINMLVYYEEFKYVSDAINHEKEVKKWRRDKKIKLIEEMNSKWQDLSENWSER